MDLAQGMSGLQLTAAVLGIALGSTALLQARSCPWILAFACWAALALCVAIALMPPVPAALLAAAVLAAVFAHVLPAGLSWALFAWLVSIAAGWTLVTVSTARPAEVFCHTAAALAGWWMFAALLVSRRPEGWARDARAAFVMTAAAAAVTALVLLGFSAVAVTIWRVRAVPLPVYTPYTAWQGLLDIGMLAVALLLIRSLGRWSAWPAAALWLTIFAGTWWGLMLPMTSPWAVSPWPSWLTWGTCVQTAWSWPLLAAVLAWVSRDWRRQERAWPDRLGELIRTSPPWKGLQTSALVIGLVLIPTGLWHTFSTGTGACQVARLTTWNMAAAALALSTFIAWRWSDTLAELALSLWSVSLAAFGATTALEWTASAGEAAPIDQMPAVQTGVLAGLAAASGLWFWLAGHWQRQLHRGRPWTAAGRLIPLADRIGFLAAALAVLVGAKMAFWPSFMGTSSDDSTERLVVASVFYLLLTIVCLYGAWQTRRTARFHLAGVVVLIWVLFLGQRW